ncbi:MAG: hypothetical protein EOO89_27935 [Pedobacter sp.]|nr:MAG: hypothetical protein EOO89_27935 [Pedobacter sp.]
MKKIVALLPLLLVGCGGCLKGFYGVHEPTTPLNIEILTDIGKEDMLNRVKRVNVENFDSLGCKYPALRITSKDKIIVHLDSCQSFLLLIGDDQIVVKGVYLKSIQKGWWLMTKEQINDSIEQYVRRQVQNNLLSK